MTATLDDVSVDTPTDPPRLLTRHRWVYLHLDSVALLLSLIHI